jgi:hypothetical protein
MLRPPPARLRSTNQQLPLPLAGREAAHPGLLPLPVVEVATHQVWASLSPVLRADVRHAARRILQEVVRDAGQH